MRECTLLQICLKILREIWTRANQLANFNNMLANDHQVAIRRTVELETALQFVRKSQNPDNQRVIQRLSESEDMRRLSATEIARLKQRLLGTETERGMQNANITALKLRLRETENIRFSRHRCVQEIQHAQSIAFRQNPAVGTQPPAPQLLYHRHRQYFSSRHSQIIHRIDHFRLIPRDCFD